MGKEAYFNIDSDEEEMLRMAHALANPVRLGVMRELTRQSRSIGELAETLKVPMSTVSLAVRVLEETGIISTEYVPGARGSLKLCSRRMDQVQFRLSATESETETSVSFKMPLGGYSMAEDIHPTCGLCSAQSTIGLQDTPKVFYNPNRFDAQLLWFREGFLEYRFEVQEVIGVRVEWLEVSFEVCSEAPMYRDPWKSDIAVEVNGRRLGIWTSPCDCGGRRGKLTPDWWSDFATQYGFLKTWRVTGEGTYIDGERLSDVCLQDLKLRENDFVSVRIGVPSDAENVGGINLFGEAFGDYPQGIVLRIGYHI